MRLLAREGKADPARGGESALRLDSYPTRAVHMTALWAYGVTQPIFSFVNGNPELLALRGATWTEVIAFALVLGLAPPLAVTAYAWVASRFSRWIGDLLFLVFLAVFSVPLALQLVGLVDPSTLLVVLAALVLPVAAVVAYARWRPVRLFLAFSLILPVLSFVSFLRAAPVFADSEFAANVDVASPTPVVVVVLDELPLSSLMARTGEIDAVRYPGFATLSRDGTWYRNATTVHQSSSAAVPAILTGRVPPKDSLPVVGDHPENLFSLLGGAYTLNVQEAVTALCPRSSCPRDRKSVVDRVEFLLTNISTHYVKSAFQGRSQGVAWDLFIDSLGSRKQGFDTFLRGLSGAGSQRTLNFVHVMLPHGPYEFLPSGRSYKPTSNDGIYSETWENDSWLVLQGYQRHLLQVAYTDAFIGRLVSRLQEADLYDRSLVVVVGDHGASFRAGDRRRPATKTNFGDIANVPLFVKYPGQDRGTVDSRSARTVDILPTIADVLSFSMPWRVDGTSLLSPPPARREAAVSALDGTTLRLPLDVVKRHTQATVARKEAQFGRGRDSLYRIGVNRDLLGSTVASTSSGSRAIRVRIEDESLLGDTRKAEGVVPARISGVVEEGKLDPGTELAVAVNGRIQALTRCFEVGEVQRFRAMVPESALREGSNRVDVFAIEVQGATRRLVRLGGTTS